MFLPRRIVHSARALNDGLSAHLTFAFSNSQCEEVPQYSNRRSEETCSRDIGGQNCNMNCNLNCPTCNNGQNCNEGCNDECDLCNDCNPCSYGTNCNESCNESCNENCNESCDLQCDVCNSGCDLCCSPPPCTCGCDLSCNDGCNESCDENCSENCSDGCNASCDTECPLTCSPSEGSNCNEECDASCTLTCNTCPPCTSADGGTECNEGCTFCPTDDWTCYCSPGCGSLDPPYPCLPGVDGLGYGFDIVQGEPTAIKIISLKVGSTPKIYTDQTAGTMYTIPENVHVESKIEQDSGEEAILYQETSKYREAFAWAAAGVGIYRKAVFTGNEIYQQVKSTSFAQRKVLVEKKIKSLQYLAKITDVIDGSSVLTPQAQSLIAGAPGLSRVEQLGTHIIVEMTFGGQVTVRYLAEECILLINNAEMQKRLRNQLSVNFAHIAAGRTVITESSNSSCDVYLSSWSQNNWIVGGDLRVWDNTTGDPEQQLQLWQQSVNKFPVVIEKRVMSVVSLDSMLEADVNAYLDSKTTEDEILLSADSPTCGKEVAEAGCKSGAGLPEHSVCFSCTIFISMTVVLYALCW
jgi:MAC/Perforin domain